MSPPPSPEGSGEFSAQERALLLRLAHDAIEAAIAGRDLEIPSHPEHLDEPRGAFTTLHLHNRLRGCVGYVFAVKPLVRTIAETALAAAFHDTRFPPVTAGETELLAIEISVLSRLQPIVPDDIEIGRHGLVVTYGSRRGLLLPQVAVEYGWDVNTFLEETCHKAGLPADAWQHGATIEAFTAEVFGEAHAPLAERQSA